MALAHRLVRAAIHLIRVKRRVLAGPDVEM